MGAYAKYLCRLIGCQYHWELTEEIVLLGARKTKRADFKFIVDGERLRDPELALIVFSDVVADRFQGFDGAFKADSIPFQLLLSCQCACLVDGNSLFSPP